MSEVASQGDRSRPYRSHKIPACDICRRRKARCIVTKFGESCRLCSERKLPCQYEGRTASAGARSPAVSENNALARGRPRSSSVATAATPKEIRTRLNATDQSTQPPSQPTCVILVGPAIAEDVERLQRHVQEALQTSSSTNKRYQTISHNTDNPALYLEVPGTRIGFEPPAKRDERRREETDRVLGRHKRSLVELYLDIVHPCFPVLDPATVKLLFEGAFDKIPSTLLVVVLALAIPLWETSAVLRRFPQPDINFAWNEAQIALNEEYLSPNMGTIAATALDLIGRPSLFLMGNIMNSARTVSLAQSFGLHRNPSTWKINDAEKTKRIRLWWGVFINDQWGSFAYNTPPSVTTSNCDVPLPKFENTDRNAASTKTMADIFLCLCSLTGVLSSTLPLVYQLQHSFTTDSMALRTLEADLESWSSNIFGSHQHAAIPRQSIERGHTNLQFCYLSLRVLLMRLALRTCKLPGAESREALETFTFDFLRGAAAEVMDFISSCTETNFKDFWLPHTAHLLVMITTILLRCALETKELLQQRKYMTKLIAFIDRLKWAKESFQWELADMCLDRFSEAVRKLADALPVSMPQTTDANPSNPESNTWNYMPYLTDDFLNSLDLFPGLDQDGVLNLDIAWSPFGCANQT